MCGRYTITLEPGELQEELNLDALPDSWMPRYNVAPTQPVGVLVDANHRVLEWMRWGLIPTWAKDPSIGSKLINARSETAAEKPSFRSAFQHRRCLIVADGFYEWLKPESGCGKSSPFYFRLKSGRAFWFAGLWESWEPAEGMTIRTCTILTTTANALVAAVHERMPVILSTENAPTWLIENERGTLQSLLKPYDSEEMEARQVSKRVNEAKLDGPECLQAGE